IAPANYRHGYAFEIRRNPICIGFMKLDACKVRNNIDAARSYADLEGNTGAEQVCFSHTGEWSAEPPQSRDDARRVVCGALHPQVDILCGPWEPMGGKRIRSHNKELNVFL